MKFNGHRVRVYKDTFGPYDAYYKRGNLYSTLTSRQTVTYAFDSDGNHYGIIRPKLYIKITLVLLVIVLLLSFSIYSLIRYEKQENFVVLYMPHKPILTSNGELVLEITNISPNTTYITVDDIIYEIFTGDTLKSVPCSVNVEYITITYNGYSTREDVVYD